MAFSDYSAFGGYRLSEPSGHFMYLLYSCLKRLLLLYNSCNIYMRIYAKEGSAGTPSPGIVYIGNMENLDWLEDSMLDGAELSENRNIRLANCGQEVRKWEGRAIVVVDINRMLTSFLPAGGHTSYPWVRQVVYMDSIEYKSRRRNIMSELRRIIRQQQFAFGMTSDPKDVIYFFEKLYLPFVRYRFGNSAHPRNLSELLKAVNNGFVVQVFHKGEWIAGDVFRVCRGEIQVLASGLLPDYQQASRRRARTVINPFLFEWASGKGYRKINLLRSRANLQDGVFSSKAHRGATPEIDSWPHSALQIYAPAGMSLPPAWASQLVKKAGKLVPLGDILEEERTARH